MVGNRQGKCSNFGNCSLADRREPIVAAAGQDFVCPECGKSLIAATPAAAPGSSRRNAVVVMTVIVLLVLLGGGLFWRSWFKTEDTRPPVAVRPEPSILAPSRPASVPPAPASAATAGPASESGDCSNTHGQVGLCAKAR